MSEDNEAFLKRLLITFKAEAEEHIHALGAGLVALEASEDPVLRAQLLETVFRETHSLKGAARAVERSEIEGLCQAAESVLAAAKSGQSELSAGLLDLLHAAVDALGRLLARVDETPSPSERARAASLSRRLAVAAAGSDHASQVPARHQDEVIPPSTGSAAAARTGPAEGALSEPIPSRPEISTPAQGHASTNTVSTTPAAAAVQPMARSADIAERVTSGLVEDRPAMAESPGTVRVRVSRLDAVLYQAEALLAAKLASRERLAELSSLHSSFASHARERTKRMAEVRAMQRRMERGDQPLAPPTAALGSPPLRRLLDHFADEDAFLHHLGAELAALAKALGHDARALGSDVDGLLDGLKRALMLPISSVLEALAKLVRDLSREQGKDVAFRAIGGELEIDRRVLEELRDPLVHLVRNSVDHGIEAPEERAARGKPTRGTLTVSASAREGGRVEIRVADDGAGIDLALLRACADKLGLPVPADDEELMALAFESGTSTSALVTEISGRGLGLAIVREKVERLGGTVRVSSSPGVGATFRLVLPLTLATFRGVHVRAAGEEFIFPASGLERVLRVRREEIRMMQNREFIRVDDEAVAMVRLADVLMLSGGGREPSPMAPAVVAGAGERRVAFLVDEVLGEQEVLVKKLGRQLRRVRNFAGATVLGNGQVVPVLFLPDLMKSARRAGRGPLPPRAPASPPELKNVLVAEDSITSRVLLKGILESAGYCVTTAVDGMDAYNRLRAGGFDLLVSDVDMPRMNGFDLTARVRADRKLADLPVVLVTALDSSDDRARGANAGANAYLVKSGFDQSNLLETVRRLL